MNIKGKSCVFFCLSFGCGVSSAFLALPPPLFPPSRENPFLRLHRPVLPHSLGSRFPPFKSRHHHKNA